MTPQDKPLFFLEDSIWKSRLRDLGCETVQALDTERRGFPTSSQWTDIYHLSSLPCSVHLLERVPSFILKLAFVWYEKTSNKAVPGISSPMRSGSQALPYRYGKRALCEAMAQPQHWLPLLQAPLQAFPLLLLHFLPQHTKVTMLNPGTDPQPIQGFCRTKPPDQTFTFASTEYFGDAEHNQWEVYAHIILIFCPASELYFTRRMICLSVLSIRKAWPRFPILVYVSFH